MLNNVFGRQTLVDAFLLAVVLIGAYWIFSASAARVTPRLDEYRYVWRGRFFEYAFLERDLRSSRWGDRYSTHTQPMMANYVIGGWLWSRGYSLEDIPPVFDGEAPIPTNRLRGWVPDNSLIAEARKPMILVGASVIGLVYLLARLLAGRIAGLATACLAIGSPLAQAHLVRATSDPLLALFVFLAVLVGMALIRVQSSGLNAAPWSIGLGIVLGLAVGTKLTALISICAVAVWPILASVIRGGAQRFSARASNGLKIGSPWVGAVGAAVVVFVLSNPHLYRNPIEHSWHMLVHRGTFIATVTGGAPEDAVYNILDRPGYVVRGSLIDGTLTGSKGWLLEAPLALLGLRCSSSERSASGKRRAQPASKLSSC